VNVKRRIEILENKIDLDSFSVIPMNERVLMISGHSKEDCEAKMNERLAAMHRKYGRFDESILTIILIPFVSLVQQR